MVGDGITVDPPLLITGELLFSFSIYVLYSFENSNFGILEIKNDLNLW
jgi:hypothetical protein